MSAGRCLIGAPDRIQLFSRKSALLQDRQYELRFGLAVAPSLRAKSFGELLLQVGIDRDFFRMTSQIVANSNVIFECKAALYTCIQVVSRSILGWSERFAVFDAEVPAPSVA